MLTKRQRTLLEFIEAYVAEHDIAPSYEEMMVGVDQRSKSVIHHRIKELEERGYIARIPARRRALAVLRSADTPPAETAAAERSHAELAAENAALREQVRLMDIALERARQKEALP